MREVVKIALGIMLGLTLFAGGVVAVDAYRDHRAAERAEEARQRQLELEAEQAARERREEREREAARARQALEWQRDDAAWRRRNRRWAARFKRRQARRVRQYEACVARGWVDCDMEGSRHAHPPE